MFHFLFLIGFEGNCCWSRKMILERMAKETWSKERGSLMSLSNTFTRLARTSRTHETCTPPNKYSSRGDFFRPLSSEMAMSRLVAECPLHEMPHSLNSPPTDSPFTAHAGTMIPPSSSPRNNKSTGSSLTTPSFVSSSSPPAATNTSVKSTKSTSPTVST